MNFRRCLQFSLLFSLLIAGGIPFAFAQGERGSGVFRRRTSQLCELKNGERTGFCYTFEQHLYDSLRRLHTSVYYEPSSNLSMNYDWFFYEKKRLVRTDHYLQPRILTHRELFFYDDSGRVARCDIYTVPEGSLDTLLYCRQTYTYDDRGRLTRVLGERPSGELMYREDYSYAKPFSALKRLRTLGEKPFDDDWKRRIDVKHLTYDSVGNVLTETRTVINRDGEKARCYNIFSYDKNGNVLTHKRYSKRGGVLLDSVRYRWFATGGIFSEEHYDAQGNRVRSVQNTDDTYYFGIHKGY